MKFFRQKKVVLVYLLGLFVLYVGFKGVIEVSTEIARRGH
jgi:hypothetical protein